MSNASSKLDASDCQNDDRHCHTPTELNLHNVFDQENDEASNADDDAAATTDDDHNDCHVETSDDNGSYITMNSNTGPNSVSADEMTARQVEERVIQFQYQIQTSLPITSFLSDASPLSIIEKAMSDVMVRDLFSNPLCDKATIVESGSVRRRRLAWVGNDGQRYMQNAMNETVWTGFKSSPLDFILPGIAGVDCHTVLVERASSCFTVGGAFTAISTMGGDTSWIESVSKAAIRDAMNQHQLNAIHDEIYDISYVSDDPGTAVIPVSKEDIVTQLVPTSSPFSESSVISKERHALIIWPWIFLPLGVVLLVIAVYEIYRYSQRYQLRSDERRLRESQPDVVNYLIDLPPPSAAVTSGGSPDSHTKRQSNVARHNSNVPSTTEYGPFRGSFPQTRIRNMVAAIVDPYLNEEYDMSMPMYADTTTDRWEYKNYNDSLVNENVPICNLDGLVDNLNTSNDTEFYGNSIASSSNFGGGSSSNDTRGRFSGRFPSIEGPAT